MYTLIPKYGKGPLASNYLNRLFKMKQDDFNLCILSQASKDKGGHETICTDRKNSSNFLPFHTPLA